MKQLEVGGVTIGSSVLGELFNSPHATAETVGIVQDYGNGVSAIEFEGDIQVIRPLPEGFSITRYRKLGRAISEAYDSDYISFRPGDPQPFSAFFKGEQRSFICLPYVEGEIIQQPADFLGMGTEFHRGVMRGLAEGERRLTNSAWKDPDLAELFGPKKWRHVGNSTPIAFRCVQLALSGALAYIPASLLFDMRRVDLISLERSLPRGEYFRQGNCELYIGRPGALLQGKRLILLEVAHAGRVPYPGQDLAKLVGRTIFPSAPKHDHGSKEGCEILVRGALEVLLENWTFNLDRDDIAMAFAALVFLQLIESYADNRWHLERGKSEAVKAIPDKRVYLQNRLSTAFMVYGDIFRHLYN